MKSSAPAVGWTREDVVARVVARLLLRVASERALGCEHGVDRDPLDALRLPARGRAGSLVRSPRSRSSSPRGMTSAPPATTGGSGESWRFLVELGHPPLEARLEVVGALAGAAGVHPRLLAGELLLLQLVRAVVPVLDLAASAAGGPPPSSGRRASRSARLTSVEVLGHGVRDRVVDARPSRRRVSSHSSSTSACDELELVGLDRPVVEVGRVAGDARLPVLGQLDELQPLRDDLPLPVVAARARSGSRARRRRARAGLRSRRRRRRASRPA